MKARLDHVVFGVRDLDAGGELFRSLGFDVQPGGRHTGRGTANALIRFGLDFIELMSVVDRDEAAGHSENRRELLSYLDRYELGLIGYAMAPAEIGVQAASFTASGIHVDGPYRMQRVRPDGRPVTWQLLVPEGVPWRRAWPFFIQWDAPDAERLEWEQAGNHPNTAVQISGLSLVVRDLRASLKLYRECLEWTPDLKAAEGEHSAQLETADGFRLVLCGPDHSADARRVLEAHGEGPWELHLHVADLSRTRDALHRANAVTVTESNDTLRVRCEGPTVLNLSFEQAPHRRSV